MKKPPFELVYHHDDLGNRTPVIQTTSQTFEQEPFAVLAEGADVYELALLILREYATDNYGNSILQADLADYQQSGEASTPDSATGTGVEKPDIRKQAAAKIQVFHGDMETPYSFAISLEEMCHALSQSLTEAIQDAARADSKICGVDIAFRYAIVDPGSPEHGFIEPNLQVIDA